MCGDAEWACPSPKLYGLREGQSVPARAALSPPLYQIRKICRRLTVDNERPQLCLFPAIFFSPGSAQRPYVRGITFQGQASSARRAVRGGMSTR